MTANSNPSFLISFASRVGSSGSGGRGGACLTLQKVQFRVQLFPKNQKDCHIPGKTLPLFEAPGFTANGMNFQLIKFMLKRI
jgi:hypothetical protein